MTDLAATPETGPVTTDDFAASLLAPVEEPATEEVTEEAPIEAAEVEETPSAESADELVEETGELVEEDEPQAVEVEAEEVHVVKVNGVEIEVAYDELAKGYSRTEDYKQKTASLADERRAFEQEKAAFQDEATAARSKMLAALSTEPPEPDWEALKAEDPIGYAEQFADYQRGKQARDAQRAQLQAQEDQERQAFAAETARKATEIFPEWAVGDGFSKGAEAREKAALAMGFKAEEIAKNQDYRVHAVLEKAALWDALQAENATSKAKVVKRVKAAPKVKLTSEAPKGRAELDAKAEEARRSKLRKSGSVDDMAALLMG